MSRENLIKTRRGLAIDWTTANPVLEEGEAGFETDTKKFKIGNGADTWNELKYVSCDGGNLDENIIVGNTIGSGAGLITLSSFFNTTQPMTSYVGVTGATMTVPSGYDYAIYIDSQGNITEEQVNQGQVLTFKSKIVAGKKKRTYGKQATCTGTCTWKWGGYWIWTAGNCKCTSNCTQSVIPNYDCHCDRPDAYDSVDNNGNATGDPITMPLSGPPYVYPKSNKMKGAFIGEVKTSPCFCKTCIPPPKAAWKWNNCKIGEMASNGQPCGGNFNTPCGIYQPISQGYWSILEPCPQGCNPDVDYIANPTAGGNGYEVCQIMESPCYCSS